MALNLWIRNRWILLLGGALLGTSLVSADTYSWGSVAMGGAGFVSGIITSEKEQNLIYARTDVGGAYRWNESTQAWIPLLDWAGADQTGFLGVEALAIDPQAPNKLYMLVGINYFNNGKTAILRSSDYGATFAFTEVTSQFTAHGNGMGRNNGERLAVDPHNSNILFCGTRSKGLFKSTDAGVSWNAVSAFPVTTTSNSNGIAFVMFDKNTGTTGKATPKIYVGVSRMGSSNMYVSADTGKSWTAMAGQTTTYMPQRAALTSDGLLYITYADGAGPYGTNTPNEPMTKGAIYKYNTNTNAWTNITPSTPGAVPYAGISVDPKNSSKIIASTINLYWNQNWGSTVVYGDRIVVSTNGGAGWTDLIGSSLLTLNTNNFPWIQGKAIHWAGSIEFDPFNPSRVFVASGNGIFSTSNLSTTSASTWKFMTKGLEESVPLDAVSLNSGVFVSVIGDYDGGFHSDLTVSPTTGEFYPSMGTSTGIAVAALAQNKLVRVGSLLYYTTDTGTNWNKLTLPSSSTKGRVALSANGNSLLWNGENATTTYRTSNWSSSWTTVSGLTFNTMPVADPMNSAKFYAYNTSSGGFYASTDSGKTFALKTTLNAGGSNIIRSAPGVEGDVWVPLYSNGLTRTTNSGTSFSKVSSVTACSAVGFGKAASGKTYPAVYLWGTVNSATGIFRSDDAGATWTRINDSAHQYGGPGNGQFVIGDMGVYGRVFMSTAGRGIAYGTLTSLMGSSSSVASSSSAAPVSTLNLPSQSSRIVAYQVCDLLGRPQSTSVNKPSSVPSGRWIVLGLDTRGQRVTSWMMSGR